METYYEWLGRDADDNIDLLRARLRSHASGNPTAMREMLERAQRGGASEMTLHIARITYQNDEREREYVESRRKHMYGW